MHSKLLSSLPLLEVKTKMGTCLIDVNRILYIEAKNKRSHICLDDLSILETCHMLKWYQERLLEPEFLRCHNSYIVNCLHVKVYKNNTLRMGDKLQIPMSRKKSRYCIDNITILKKIAYQSLHKDDMYSLLLQSTS